MCPLLGYNSKLTGEAYNLRAALPGYPTTRAFTLGKEKHRNDTSMFNTHRVLRPIMNNDNSIEAHK